MDKVYDAIAEQFDRTRHAHWKCVRDFLDKLQPNSFVADIGCGNGKNLTCRNDLYFIANDISNNLLSLAKAKNDSRHNDFILANGLALPYRNDCFDAVMSIAVLHHISTPSLREKYVSEIMRCVKPGGFVLVTVWATTQPKKSNWVGIGNEDYLVPWKGQVDRYYHFFSECEILQLFKEYNITEHREECYNHCMFLRKNDFL